MEMVLALLSFSSPESSLRVFDNMKGDGSVLTKLAKAAVIEQFRAKRFEKLMSERYMASEKPPRETMHKENKKYNLQSEGEYFDETKYQAPGSEQDAFENWERKLQTRDFKGAEEILRKRSPNLRDKNGATIPTKIGQMENEDDRRRAWIMFTQNNGDVNIEDMNKQTAIFHAKNAWETNHIANMGANLDHRDKNGDTALHNAIKNKNTAKSQTLIDKGADINIKNYDQKTPLMLAIEYEDYETAENLIKHGANINAMDAEGKTVMDYEIRDANIRKLLQERMEEIKQDNNEVPF